MDNYEYIVASLPVLRPEDSRSDNVNAEALIAEIREQLSGRDQTVLDQLLAGYDDEQLTEDFYRQILRHKNRFLREWFRFDLDLRNATVGYLNHQLHRAPDHDKILLEEREVEEFPELEAAERILRGADILQRERGLDELRWHKVDEITLLDYFDLETLLGYVAKLKIIDRWLQLDPDSGRALFRRMVEEIRTTYDNKKQNITI
ncbi:MAG: DUF2764 family protein [Bacteroidales bacterium]|nr:DUF2764 family protein [Bacteroidales bacterium]MBR1577448.1 DUF2764 family protein [Bacteroidales bacterium]